jgi:NAD-dependent SIR2 family protein deacetylase
MRFLTNGPNIPEELITSQEKGQTIFVCGAGVSRTTGLPLFRGLVEGVYQLLGEDWNLHIAEREGMTPGGALDGQYDRVLRCLERRLAGSDSARNRGMRERIRAAIRQVLTPPLNPDFGNHLALLELSRDAEGVNRLLTTNFDTIFERAWFDHKNSAVASHAGAAMPQPKASGFSGVLHLHGRLADSRAELALEETDLVLTSAEFGDAYLRSGWASRYVYDLVRAYTVVLVGYQADDPPMRYLLEALETDRERFPDLQKVYAFASCAPGNEDVTRELWRAKAVEPILYNTDNGEHSPLYLNIREWRRYAEEPTAWRREQLRIIFNEGPVGIAEERMQECVALLSHGDASQLLGELSPSAAWLPVLIEKRVFDRNGVGPGEWITARINDPDMIRACAALHTFSDQTRWHIGRAIERERAALTSVRLRAWQLMLASKRGSTASDLDDNWYLAAGSIKKGEAGFEARRLVSGLLRPWLTIKKVYFRYRVEKKEETPEALYDLISIDFEAAEHPSASEILAAWPHVADQEIALFRTLDRAVLDSLEEAADVGFLDGWDRASRDVPSVAEHAQNAYHKGFYPITRALADLWRRIAARDANRARALILAWADLPYLLTQRLWLFALTEAMFTAQDAAVALLKLDDKAFWGGDAQVEIMRLMTARWQAFTDAERAMLETRLRQGIPRTLFPGNAFGNEEEWISIQDSSRYRRLRRIQTIGGVLSPESVSLLDEIAARHPKWQPSSGDRDDFSVWHESSYGPEGHPELLETVADDALVKEAMRLQRERHFEEGDVWRVFCSADPYRALRGLKLDGDADNWQPEAWRNLIWAAVEKGEPEFQFELADLFLRMPDAPLVELLPSITSWLQRRRELLSATDRAGGPRFLRLWDRFADLTYANAAPTDAEPVNDRDILTSALNEPGGVLAWTLLDALSAPKPLRGAGLGAELTPRFSRVVGAAGRAGLLARVYLMRALAYFDAIDAGWTEAHLQPLLAWDQPESLALWKSYSQGQTGSARLFNTLKSGLLQAFERHDLSDHEYEGLVAQILSVGIGHRQGEAADYNLTTAEIKRALTMGPPAVRQNASWNFWRMMGEADGVPKDKAERWRTIHGPLFRDIWPLDAGLRSEATTRNLVHMAQECESAFPEAVEAILDLIVPYQLYSLAHSLRLEPTHDQLVRQFPVAFIRLANALIDPARYPVPNDLAALLQEGLAANPAVAYEPSYVRLFGLRRQRSA